MFAFDAGEFVFAVDIEVEIQTGDRRPETGDGAKDIHWADKAHQPFPSRTASSGRYAGDFGNVLRNAGPTKGLQ